MVKVCREVNRYHCQMRSLSSKNDDNQRKVKVGLEEKKKRKTAGVEIVLVVYNKFHKSQ